MQRIINQKEGSKEFALFYHLDGEPVWVAMLGNELPHALGESRGEYLGSGDSPEEAIESLRSNLTKGILNLDNDWLLALSLTPWLKGFAKGREYSIWNDDKDRLYNDLSDYMRSKCGGDEDG
jgi:hypothetical protein